ncbi:NUDIX domain-containing protein [Nonomuraea jiangxiensis]|uniref:8-oxo-dGTP pyrophosphatase MutT, NUDIX family n=1 Tax=Nonomuraea jiangxiensis TaxID=633440 RepID=A0A1G9FRX2_9ACTN|nr:NUDIX domain-containing protein [Nonomuraea jiangxiensis]SDK91158.1 8-oxo-dGTP pyrophosphatase MutT, NUDIX family [Nonomuraea jiangxiensis]
MTEPEEPAAGTDRPAARVVCLDRDGRVLLMHWYDQIARKDLWEPPGGGIDPGETALEAARRELTEETGLPGSAVRERFVEVRRDFWWLGVRYVKTEPFFLARFDEPRPAVDPGELTEEERLAYLGYEWAEELPAAVEPPDLAAVVAALTAGPAAGATP